MTGPAYSGPSTNINAQEAINFFHSIDRSGGKAVLSLIGRFGLDLFSHIGAAEIRATINVGDLAYVVAGNTFYSVDNTGTATVRGTLNTAMGRVGIASNGYDVTMVDSTNGYRYLISTATFTQIVAAGFPNGATDISFVNQFYVVDNPALGTMQTSAINNGLNWAALDFAVPESDPDGLVRCMSIHGTIWALGESTTEPWYYAALPYGMPFLPNRSGVIDMGIAARWSAVKADNTLYWLAQNKEGIYGIVKLGGYNVDKVSTPAIDHAIRGYATILDCTAFAFTEKGHTFIVFTFPTANKSWVYDSATQLWAEWQSYGIGAFRCGFYMYFNNRQILGDRTTGRLYSVNWDTYTDNGDIIESARTCQHLSKNGGDIEINSLIIDIEAGVGTLSGQGSDPKIMLDWSKDGGHTWSNRFDRSMGTRGKYATRVKWDRLGTAVNWTLRVKITDPVKRVIIGAYAEIAEGVD